MILVVLSWEALIWAAVGLIILLECLQGKQDLVPEPKHPSTNLFIIKGPAIGDIREKKVGIACSYFKAINKTELWTNLGDGWKKQCEGKDVGGFKPNSNINETQLRIDGFETEPTIHSAVVTEIAAQG